MSGSDQKILLFIETGGPGGAERVVASLASSYREMGIDVGVATLRTGWLTDELAAQGTTHHHLPSSRSLDIGLVLRLKKLIRESGYTAVHSHLVDSNFYAALASRLAGVAHVATEHGDVHHVKKKRFLHLKLKVTSWLGSRFTAVSGFSADALCHLGVRRDKIQVIGNPVSQAKPINSDERSALRKEVVNPDAASNHWLWIHVANLRKVKDQETLIRGFAASRRNSKKSQSLCLVGDGRLRAELETLCEQLGCKESVYFLGFRNDVPRLLQAANGFILSSHSEALPMALLEASLANLLIVSSDVGGIPELIQHKETGLLFPSGNHDALAEALTSVVENSVDHSQIAAKAAEYVRVNFSEQTIAKQYLRLFDKKPRLRES